MGGDEQLSGLVKLCLTSGGLAYSHYLRALSPPISAVGRFLLQADDLELTARLST